MNSTVAVRRNAGKRRGDVVADDVPLTVALFCQQRSFPAAPQDVGSAAVVVHNHAVKAVARERSFVEHLERRLCRARRLVALAFFDPAQGEQVARAAVLGVHDHRLGALLRAAAALPAARVPRLPCAQLARLCYARVLAAGAPSSLLASSKQRRPARPAAQCARGTVCPRHRPRQCNPWYTCSRRSSSSNGSLRLPRGSLLFDMLGPPSAPGTSRPCPRGAPRSPASEALGLCRRSRCRLGTAPNL